MPTPRIAIAGFQHETNTFSPLRATYDDFVKPDSWPGLTTGADLIDVFTALNIPIGGFITQARNKVDLIPILWAQAEPSAHVNDEAFNRITEMICEGISAAGKIDAVYLDLHGAMVTDSHLDGEGEVLRRVRSIIGRSVPLVISLDLHANITKDMTGLCDAMTIFRTYPHIDMAETGARAFLLLEELLEAPLQNRIPQKRQLHKAFHQLPFLLPLSAQSTDYEPCKSLYDLLPAASNAPGLVSADIATGFPPADMGAPVPAIVTYGRDPQATEQQAKKLLDAFLAARDQFDTTLTPASKAVARAIAAPRHPVILVDTQDNPGAGATSDTTGLLQELITQKADAVLAILWDPEAAAAAQRAGKGSEILIGLGGRHGPKGVAPYEALFHIEKITNGRFTCTGPMYGGSHADLGKMVLFRVVNTDVRVIVASERFQCADQAIFRHMGIDPGRQKILAIKSTVHFRNDFADLAAEIILTDSPGTNPCHLEELDYQHLQAGIDRAP